MEKVTKKKSVDLLCIRFKIYFFCVFRVIETNTHIMTDRKWDSGPKVGR